MKLRKKEWNWDACGGSIESLFPNNLRIFGLIRFFMKFGKFVVVNHKLDILVYH